MKLWPACSEIMEFLTSSYHIVQLISVKFCTLIKDDNRSHGGRVVTLLPPTSEAGVRSSAWPQVGKLVVTCRWSAVYSTEP